MLVLGLLGGTAAAFVLTQNLKGQPSPVAGQSPSTPAFSPVCRCSKREVLISFRLRRPDRLTLLVVDGDGDVVRRLAEARQTRAGPRSYRWDGRDDAGRIVAEGSYRPRVELDAADRSIVLPNPIRVDVTVPRIRLEQVAPRTISPDGDRRGDLAVLHYRVNERAHAVLFVEGRRHQFGKYQRLRDRVEWNGNLDGKLPPGTYRLTLRAEDTAGNLSPATRAVPITIRYIALARPPTPVRARRRFDVGVETDARSYRWRFAGREGRSSRARLELRAPRPGRYALAVSARGHADRTVVVVRAA